MCGWTAQKYGYVPGDVKVKENFSSVSSVPELKARGLTELVAVCGTSSWFTHVTFVPGAIVTVAGLNVKLSMTIVVSATGAVVGAAAPTTPAACVSAASALGAFKPARLQPNNRASNKATTITRLIFRM